MSSDFRLIDSHCHLEDEVFDTDRDQDYEAAVANNVDVIILAGSDLDTSKKIVELTKKYPGVYGIVGVHPHEAKDAPEGYLEVLRELVQEAKILGIGEIGLDYYYDHSPREEQMRVFREQLELAKELDKPFAIHSREAALDTIDTLKEVDYHNGILHCYSYSVEVLREIVKLGYSISLGGAVTFKNAKKPVEVVREVPLDRLLLETDAPYLTPVPFRGKRNEPKLVFHVAEKIAEIKGLTIEEEAMATFANTERFFNYKF